MNAKTHTDDSSTEHEYEVGVRGMDGDFEHITVTAESPEEAYQKAVDEVEGIGRPHLEEPVTAYQAYDLDEMRTYRP